MTGGFNIQNNLQAEVFTKIPQQILKSMFHLIQNGNVQLIQWSIENLKECLILAKEIEIKMIKLA